MPSLQPFCAFITESSNLDDDNNEDTDYTDNDYDLDEAFNASSTNQVSCHAVQLTTECVENCDDIVPTHPDFAQWLDR